jgi:hypothetical protein
VNGAVVFTLSVAFGAALLAVWLDARLPSLAPRSLTARLVAAGAAWLLVDGAARLFERVLATAPVEPRELVALGVILPALVATFLTGLWLLRSLGAAASTR